MRDGRRRGLDGAGELGRDRRLHAGVLHRLPERFRSSLPRLGERWIGGRLSGLLGVADEDDGSPFSILRGGDARRAGQNGRRKYGEPYTAIHDASSAAQGSFASLRMTSGVMMTITRRIRRASPHRVWFHDRHAECRARSRGTSRRDTDDPSSTRRRCQPP